MLSPIVQMELQSCVATAVQAGPMKIADTFLRFPDTYILKTTVSPRLQDGLFQSPDQAKLVSSFTRLLETCSRF